MHKMKYSTENLLLETELMNKETSGCGWYTYKFRLSKFDKGDIPGRIS